MLRRRTFLTLGAAAIAASARSAIAAPAPYPVRPVSLIIGFSAGGNTDIVARRERGYARLGVTAAAKGCKRET